MFSRFVRWSRTFFGGSGQAGPLEEGLPERLPTLLREEIVLEPAESLAVLDREVARPEILLELHQQGALPRLPVWPCRRSRPGATAASG